jgi:hypothetical protein
MLERLVRIKPSSTQGCGKPERSSRRALSSIGLFFVLFPKMTPYNRSFLESFIIPARTSKNRPT